MNDIIITATEYVSDSIFGDGIKVTIQNNTDGEVLIGCSALIVNNYMINDVGTKQNQYTGIFEGKNVIMVLAPTGK